ncbi:hypothetical protein GCM10010384_61380 [Streptomyces djakartensis]|uniref:Uncharacterized protein n=1 Tax=Streptomyces djakartensis TaxID=68193 RepID=A0ABQ3AFB0_9ACTN|nr:hypothetical protein GCM10010384_61380 [Streptomyces djakartensis]
MYPRLRFASLYVAIGTARNTGLHWSPEPLFNSQELARELAGGPSLVEGFVKAFTFTSTCM